MPSHWGNPALHIVSQGSPTGTQCLQAVGVAEAGRLYERIDAIPDREQHFEGDEVVYCSRRRRRHQRRRVLGIAEHGVAREAARRLPRRRQRLRHLGSGRSPDGGRHRSRTSSSAFPHLKVLRVDGCDFVKSFAAHARRRAVGARTAWSGAGPRVGRRGRTRTRCRTMSGCTRRRRNGRPRPSAIRSRSCERCCCAKASTTESDLEQMLAERRPRDCRGDRTRARSGEAGAIDRRRLGVLTGRRSDVRRVRLAGRADRANPTRWWPPSTARCATRWRTTRASSCSARMSPTAAAKIT